jgi:hypothetical protein
VVNVGVGCGYARGRPGSLDRLPDATVGHVCSEHASRIASTLADVAASVNCHCGTRHATGRALVLMFDGKYHGDSDEMQMMLADGEVVDETPGLAPGTAEGVRLALTIQEHGNPAPRTPVLITGQSLPIASISATFTATLPALDRWSGHCSACPNLSVATMRRFYLRPPVRFTVVTDTLPGTPRWRSKQSELKSAVREVLWVRLPRSA